MSIAEKYLISIIIPYHDNKEQVKVLLDTIPDNGDVEVILVNDIFDAKLLGYTRFSKTKYVELRNSPPAKWAGASRNTGVKYSSSKYIVFADSDDKLLTKQFLQLLTTLNVAGPFDYAVSLPTSVLVDTGKIGTRHLVYKKMINEFIISNNKISLLRHHVPWGKIFSRSFLWDNQLKFEEVIASNDVLFSLSCCLASEKIVFIDNAFYCATESNSSLSRTMSKKIALSRFKEAVKYNDLLIKYNLKDYLYPMYWWLVMIRKYSPISYPFSLILCFYKGYPLWDDFPQLVRAKIIKLLCLIRNKK